MKVVLVLVAAITLASAGIVDIKDEILINKVQLNDKDVKIKERIILKLLNYITQETAYHDILEVAQKYNIVENMDMYLKSDVVKSFIYTWKMGMLPKGEIFTISNHIMMKEAIKVFHILYYAKDFDTFIKTACWLREHINEGMFVYALTVACLHRTDCKGIVLPAPYEIYPYYFVNSDVIEKAYRMKMRNGKMSTELMKYYDIKINDKNMVTIYSTKDIKTVMNKEDMLTYFTEDIDLNSYYYYFNMEYPMWMGDDVFGVNKERRGEMFYYIHQQLLARYNLERFANKMSDVKMLNWNLPLKTGYWPRLRDHTGIDMPVRNNDHLIINRENTGLMLEVEDYEHRIRDAVMKGFVTLKDGTRIDLNKPEDIEMLGRLVIGNLDKVDAKAFRYLILCMKAMLLPTNAKMTLTANVMDQYMTALRDPVFWQLQKRLVNFFLVFKKLLPAYTHNELDFPGVKIESIAVDKLVTFFDDCTIDISNALVLNEEEMKKQKADMIFLNKQKRLNHQTFKINIDVESDKTVDAVVRIFLGPKYDNMGKLLTLNEKRLDFVEIDAFKFNLKTGKNVITRESSEMHNIIHDRHMTRMMWDKTLSDMDQDLKTDDNYFYKYKLGFPKRLLLPKGTKNGLEMQMFVVITPVQMDKTISGIDLDYMLQHNKCRWTVCMDTKALGFPLDRIIDPAHFTTKNMHFIDVEIFHKNLDDMNRVTKKGTMDTMNVDINLDMMTNENLKMDMNNEKSMINKNMFLKRYYIKMNE